LAKRLPGAGPLAAPEPRPQRRPPPIRLNRAGPSKMDALLLSRIQFAWVIALHILSRR
jgi:hypothetical protein